MATLEEIAKQFEDALATETGTTIAPGTITPQGVTSSVSGKKKLSWPEIVDKMNEGVGIGRNELLPDVPKGMTAQKFYRSTARSGVLPSGALSFTSSPFGSFQSRVATASGRTPESTEPSAPKAVDAPQSVVQTVRQQQQQDDGSLTDSERDYLSPISNPNFNPLALLFPGGGLATFFGSGEEEEGDGRIHTDLSGYESQQIDAMIEDGLLNSRQIAAYQNGIRHMDSFGNPVDNMGLPLSKNEYFRNQQEEFDKNIINKGIKKVFKMFDTNYDYGKGDYTVGYQDDGTFKSAGGTHSLMGTEKDFEALTATNPALAWSIAQQRGRGGFFGLEPDDYDKAKAAAAKASRGDLGLAPKRIDSTNKLIHKSSFSPAGDAGYDTSVPSDAAGAEQGSFGGEGGGYDPSADISFGDEGTSVATSAAASGGEIRMQEGGNVPEMPQQGAEGDMANLGMINEQAAPPQQGGQQSVKDDVPREADEGDYILPYETVLLVGLKDLNRYAREAIDLAMKNGVDLAGTDLDPTDDVPIKVSNYEYHIPKVLVAFFGGGKKYLDKIREEGLALRKRLEEEKQPSAQEQQPQVPMQEAPPQMEPQAAPPPEMAQAAPAPQPPMMQRGGFVLSPDEKKQPTTEAMLEADTTQAQESSYNQMQALERTRKQAQQPPMVDPTGKIVQQGFAAPQGYQDGDMVEDPDLMIAVAAKTEPPMPDWANRALDPKTPVMMNEETGEPQTLGLITDKINDMFHVYPTIRMVGKDLKRYDADEALSITMKKKDSIKFKTEEEANSWSDRLVSQVSELRNLQNGQPDMPPTVEEVSPPMPQEELPPMPEEEMQGFAQQQQPMIA